MARIDRDFLERHKDRIVGGLPQIGRSPILNPPENDRMKCRPGPSIFEQRVLNRIRLAGLPDPEKEHRFHPKRMWRFDFAYPGQKLAIECEGGSWTQGAHTRGKGFREDCEKYNAAVILGWRVLRYSVDMLDKVVEDLRQCLR